MLDIPRLVHWLLFKQVPRKRLRRASTHAHPQGCIEGGFAGRTNKLVDGCYTFWQGALVAALAPAYALQLGPQAPRDAARSLAARVVLRPSPCTPAGGPGAQARAAEARAAEGLHATVLADAPDLPCPQSLPVRADALGAAAGQHRRWLQQSALALCDPAAREAMAAEDPEAAPTVEADVRGAPPASLCNTSAVQLWVLQCCQGVRWCRWLSSWVTVPPGSRRAPRQARQR